MPKNVFIAYDFAIGGNLTLNLEAVAELPGDGFMVRWPGAPGDQSQGAIWRNIVEPGIQWCDRLLAFADLPNANVSFELGYALALKKEAALARVRKELPGWLAGPPMNGFICKRAETHALIQEVIRGDKWFQILNAPGKGNGVLLLCPPESAALTKVDQAWKWRQPKRTRWDLHDVPEIFADVGRVVWIIDAHHEGPEGRDGVHNAALATLAGYALGRELPLDVFHHTSARKVVDVAARHEPFASLPQLRTLLESVVDDHQRAIAARAAPAPTAAQVAILTAEAARPKDLRPLPDDEWEGVHLPRFIGRERELLDAEAAMSGVARGEPTAARVLWVYGFGGMGKSWFLRRTALEVSRAVPELGVLLVEWDSPTWREPLEAEPIIAAHLCRPIAHRLAQVRGVAAADPFWLASARVEQGAEAHRALERDFESGLLRASQGERIESALSDLLQAEGLMDENGKVRSGALEKWRADIARRDRVFEAWARRVGSRLSDSDADSAIVPKRVLEQGLAAALRSAASTAPLLLILDTCEVLTEELDRALRSLITSLVRDHARVLVLIGSRLAPDVAQPSGSREGWRAELPRTAVRELSFGENVRFTVEEIEAALPRLTRPAPQVKDLAQRLHAITHGVPLSLRALFDLHEQVPGSTILTELAAPDEAPMEEGEAVRSVIATVANRMLYHLANRADREDDLADIIALALMPRADATVLALLWRSGVRPRLRALATRYSLLGGGDLHATVRRYLRRHWRGEEKPAVFDAVLKRLEEIASALPTPQSGDGIAAALDRRLLQVTLASWRKGADCVDELARGVAVALAHDEGTGPFLDLLREMTETLSPGMKSRNVLPKGEGWEGFAYSYSGRLKVFRWVCDVADDARDWTTDEQACVFLLHGLTTGPPESIEQATSCVNFLLRAVDHFTPAHTPQPRAVADALWSAGFYLSTEERIRADRTSVPLIERAYLQAVTLTPSQAGLHNNLGILYIDHLGRPQDAERAYLKAIELDPKFAYPHNNLGILYMDDLGRPQDAERAYLKAIELDPKYATAHYGLGILYMDHLGRPQDAERAYLKAIELDPKFATAHNGLGNLYKNHLGRPQDAERAYLKATELDP